MSISMKFVPYALALRNVMGKDRYDAWLRSREKIYNTVISDEGELRSLVARAGMDWSEFGRVRKTHMGNTHFFWQRQAQQWQAVFSVDDDPDLVQQTVGRLEQAYGGMLWLPSEACEQPFFATEFADEQLLMQALCDCGLAYQITREGDLLCADGMLRFRQGADGMFYLSVHSKDFKHAFSRFSTLDNCYRQRVQDRAYLNLIEALEENPGAKLLEERIEADNTIVLTIQMQEQQ